MRESKETMKMPLLVGLFAAASLAATADAFVVPPSGGRTAFTAQQNRESSSSRLFADKMSKEEIKAQLQEYLKKRKELNADEEAKKEKGKVVGGTQGNKVLEYVSGAPVKELVIDRVPNIFDYDQLSKYGYSSLVTPIMNMGGRPAVYELMEMDAPAVPPPPPPKKFTKLVIDRKGENDPARYSGLKMGQVMDDDVMAEALANANAKVKLGERLRPVLEEEKYVAPFADKRNTSPAQTPNWTPESLDEYGRQMGKAQDWARKAKMGRFVSDPYETMDLSASFRAYFLSVMFLFAFAFGRSTPTLLGDFLHMSDTTSLPQALQAPALVLTLASIGSSVVCGALFASDLNRSKWVWGMKGLIGGPLAISQIRGLDKLVTYAEQEEDDKQQRQQASQ